MDRYMQETKMLDYSNNKIQQLISERMWKSLEEFECLKAIYNFVRDEILFGYNTDDSIPASKVLADGYGQCNTKGTLFMALLRACNIPCRVHGFTIDKALQKGAMTGIVYKNATQNVFHSWASFILKINGMSWKHLFLIKNTYIQSEEINQDFGVYDSPDELLEEHHQEMSVIKAFVYKNFGRHLMNRNVKRIRNS